MPGFDGTGLSDRDPLTGQCRGFCALGNSEKRLHQLQGLAGLQPVLVGQAIANVQRIDQDDD